MRAVGLSHSEWKAIPNGKPFQMESHSERKAIPNERMPKRKQFRKESNSEWEVILNGWHGLVCAGPSHPFNKTLRAILAQKDPFNNTLRVFLATTDSLTIPYGRFGLRQHFAKCSRNLSRRVDSTTFELRKPIFVALGTSSTC